MERLPFAQLNSERSKMMERLRQMPIADRGVRLRAINELETRVQNWWGGDLPPLSQHVVTPPNRHPVDLPADPAEVWIVRAISPTSRPAVFGVKKDGAVYTVDSTGQYQMFVTGLSSLLDQAADLCRLNNNGSELLERDGRFYTSFNEERQALAVVVSSTSSDGVHVNQRGFWRRIVSVLPWVHDDPQGRSRPSGADEQERRPDRCGHRLRPALDEQWLGPSVRPIGDVVLDPATYRCAEILRCHTWLVGPPGYC